MEKEHAKGVMTGLIELEEIRNGIHGRRERTVQPTTTLANQLNRAFGYISLGLAGLDVGQGPLIALLRNQLETEDTI